MHRVVQERLTELLGILRAIIAKHPTLNSTHILGATGNLIAKVKGQHPSHPPLRPIVRSLPPSLPPHVSVLCHGAMYVHCSLTVVSAQRLLQQKLDPTGGGSSSVRLLLRNVVLREPRRCLHSCSCEWLQTTWLVSATALRLHLGCVFVCVEVCGGGVVVCVCV